MKTEIRFILVLLTGLLSGGCSKHDTKPRNSNCHIQSVTLAIDSSSTFLTYYADGKLKTKTISVQPVNITTTDTYTYTGDTMIETVMERIIDSYFFSKTTIQFNADGLPLNYLEVQDTAGSIWTKCDYIYDGSQLNKINYTDFTGMTQTYTYNWSDGNIISEITPFDTLYFDYYTDRPNSEGAGIEYSLFSREGIVREWYYLPFLQNKNLIKSISGATKYSYDFDATGKITSTAIRRRDTLVGVVKYQYECP